MKTKADRRAAKRWRKRYGHSGSGASHTRTTSEAEVKRHIQKIKRRPRWGGSAKAYPKNQT